MSATVTANSIFDGIQDTAIQMVLDANRGRALTRAQFGEAVARTHAELFVVALEKLDETHPDHAAAIRAEFLRENG